MRNSLSIYCNAALIILLEILNSCSKDRSIVTREEVLPGFSVIHVHQVAELVLVQDTCYKITVAGEGEVVNSIMWDVKDDTLRIRDTGSSIFHVEETPRLTIHFSDLTWLTTFKPAAITSYDTIRLDYFYIYSIGEIGEANLTVDCNTFGLDNSANTLGRFYIKGRAESVFLFNRYGSSIVADSLICREAQVINESVGDVFIGSEELLRVYIWGTGNIYYYGNPEIQIMEKRNSGELIHLR